MSNDVKDNLKSHSTWKRGLYMLLYIIFSRIAEVVLGMVVLFQFLLKLFTGETNDRLLKLGQGLSTYLYQAFQVVFDVVTHSDVVLGLFFANILPWTRKSSNSSRYSS